MPLKVALFFVGLFRQFQAEKIATAYVTVLSSRQSDPKTEIIVSRARVQAFKAWMNGEVG